jgi:hypothetical protein
MFNGTVNILDLKPITCVQTDACLQGGAGYYEGDFFYVNWDTDLRNYIVPTTDEFCFDIEIVNCR